MNLILMKTIIFLKQIKLMMTLMISKMEELRYLPSQISQTSDKILKYSQTVDKKTHLQINLKAITYQKMVLEARIHKVVILIRIGYSNSHLRTIINRLMTLMKRERKALEIGQMALLMETINNPNYWFCIVSSHNLTYQNQMNNNKIKMNCRKSFKLMKR